MYPKEVVDNPVRHLDYYRRIDNEFVGERIQYTKAKQIRISAYQLMNGKNMVDVRLWTTFKDSEGVYFPRKKGLCLPVKFLNTEVIPSLIQFLASPDTLEA